MNTDLFFYFYSFAHQSVLVDRLIVFTAQTFPYVVLILAGLFILFHHEIFRAENPLQVLRQKYREISSVLFSVIFAYLFSLLLKILFHTPRPFQVLDGVNSLFLESGYAFPSGHSTVFMALGLAIYLMHRKAGYFFIFFAFLIGLARVMSGVHSPVDILGGFIFGAIIAILARKIFLKFAYFQRKM